MTLGDLLTEAALDLPGTDTILGPDGAVTWSRGGRAFAALSEDGGAAEFNLDLAVAEAAVRTPDVTLSGRGPGWVSFSPSDLDDRAADRAVAWLASAYRRVEPRN
jgi:hypothetical protein